MLPLRLLAFWFSLPFLVVVLCVAFRCIAFLSTRFVITALRIVFILCRLCVGTFRLVVLGVGRCGFVLVVPASA